MELQAKIETITPEIARLYLKQNVDNYRKVSRAKVKLYADEMAKGKWQLNGEGITFDENGYLKNGQHRLEAILVANKPVEMLVIRGVKNDTYIYDNGIGRTMTQIARASGCGNTFTNAESGAATAIVGNFKTVGKALVLDWLINNHAEINRARRLCKAGSGHQLSRKSACVLATYLLIRNGKMPSYDIEVFFEIFNSGNIFGADGYEASPALVARRMFIDEFVKANGHAIKNQTEVLLQAMMDFENHTKRKKNYKVGEETMVEDMINRIRKEDGLD